MAASAQAARALVTGASGFIGSNVTRALLAQGRAVRVLLRRSSSRIALEGLDIEVAEGDVTCAESCLRAARGCAEVYHCAALYKLFVRDEKEIYEINVGGTRNMLQAAGRAGARRIVYTSTVGTLGNPGDGTPGDEDAPVSLADMVGPYKQSKFLAEQEALRLFREDRLPVVIVNPSAPVGPWDVKPTPTGQFIVDFLRGKMPAYLDTGLNLIDVEDCARGHLLAAERGRPGEKYVLGGEDLTLQQILALLAEITALPAPRIKLPRLPILALAYLSEALARSLGWPREPRVSVAAVKMAKKKMWFSTKKARRELGLKTRPPREALERASQWFYEHGYAERPA